MKTVLVTGTSGYLGQAAARHLAANGWRVREIRGRADFAQAVASAFAEEEIACVVHAGFSVDYRLVPYLDVDSENIANSRCVAAAAAHAGAHFIFLSAAAVLGVANRPLHSRGEDAFARSDSGFNFWLESSYVREKIAAEALIAKLPLDLSVLYLTTTYGPGMQMQVRSSLQKTRRSWLPFKIVPYGGTSYLGLEDFLTALDIVVKRRLTGRFVLSSGNLSYRELFRTLGEGRAFSAFRVYIRMPHWLFRPLRAVLFCLPHLNSTAILLSSFGYKYYSPQKFMRVAAWHPASKLARCLEDTLR